MQISNNNTPFIFEEDFSLFDMSQYPLTSMLKGADPESFVTIYSLNDMLQHSRSYYQPPIFFNFHEKQNFFFNEVAPKFTSHNRKIFINFTPENFLLNYIFQISQFFNSAESYFQFKNSYLQSHVPLLGLEHDPFLFIQTYQKEKNNRDFYQNILNHLEHKSIEENIEFMQIRLFKNNQPVNLAKNEQFQLNFLHLKNYFTNKLFAFDTQVFRQNSLLFNLKNTHLHGNHKLIDSLDSYDLSIDPTSGYFFSNLFSEQSLFMDNMQYNNDIWINSLSSLVEENKALITNHHYFRDHINGTLDHKKYDFCFKPHFSPIHHIPFSFDSRIIDFSLFFKINNKLLECFNEKDIFISSISHSTRDMFNPQNNLTSYEKFLDTLYTHNTHQFWFALKKFSLTNDSFPSVQFMEAFFNIGRKVIQKHNGDEQLLDSIMGNYLPIFNLSKRLKKGDSFVSYNSDNNKILINLKQLSLNNKDERILQFKKILEQFFARLSTELYKLTKQASTLQDLLFFPSQESELFFNDEINFESSEFDVTILSDIINQPVQTQQITDVVELFEHSISELLSASVPLNTLEYQETGLVREFAIRLLFIFKNTAHPNPIKKKI